jgi:hypothetical protein
MSSEEDFWKDFWKKVNNIEEASKILQLNVTIKKLSNISKTSALTEMNSGF